MDLQTATRLNGPRWQLARIGALMFLILTCGLLASSLMGVQISGLDQRAGIERTLR